MRPKPGRVSSVIKTLAAVVSANTITHAEAATLRGKLQFLLCTVGFAARAGRSALAAFAAVRRGGRAGRRSIPLPASLIAAIAFWVVIYETLLSGRHHHEPPRTTGFLGVLALVLIILILLFDILLLVDSVDKWRLQLTKYANNESVLEAESDTIKRDTDVLIMTATFYSFALGSMTSAVDELR